METPQGVVYNGKRSATNKICGASILRAGETMEQAVCDVCKDIRIGKILIQTNLQTDEPEVHAFFYHTNSTNYFGKKSSSILNVKSAKVHLIYLVFLNFTNSSMRLPHKSCCTREF